MNKFFLFVMLLVVSIGLVACGGTQTVNEIKYTVTFDTQGGQSVTAIEVKAGSIVTLSNYSTSKDGFTFTGWSLTSNGTVLSNTYTVNSNVTLYAQFTQNGNTYEISFYDEDGTLLTKKTVNEGVSPTHTYEPMDTVEWDYTFEGWKSSLESTTIIQTLPSATAAASYYATVSAIKKQYTVTFVTNGGSTVNSVKVDYGTEIQPPAEPTREGFVFVAWAIDVNLTTESVWPLTVDKNITLYASWNEKIQLGTYLERLIDTFEYDVMDFIPEKMQPGSRLVNASQTTLDYSAFVNVSNIPTGYGEQWQMVLDNLEQTKSFTSVLSVVDIISVSAVTLFNNYIDSNPENVNEFTFTSGIYTVDILFEEDTIYLVVDYTANVPGFGSQTVQIMLNYNIDSEEKEGRIQIGDANALRYVITEDSYTFAIKYFGIRRAYFNIHEKEEGIVEGSIFEFLGLDNSVSTSSAAQFLITDDYVSVVGNKASGIVGFTGNINELYNPNTGVLLGYEIRETVSSLTYNTLWFNLIDQTGINSIKKVDQANGSNPDSIFVNGSTSLFTSKTVGGFTLKNLSRRYDIEFRKQYVYYMNGEVLTRVEIEVPMLFVQAEQYSTVVTDIKANNSNLSTFDLTVSSQTKAKIEADYATMIDIFIANKENIKVEDILSYIGNKH